MRPVRRAKVADGDTFQIFRDEDVVELDIAMKHAALLHVQQPVEHLPRVHPNRRERDADVDDQR